MVNNTKRRVVQAGDIIAVLAEFFPACFADRHKPLKRGIHRDIAERLTGTITGKEIGVALRAYTGSVDYLGACIEGAPRVDLAGKVAGIVTAAEAGYARELVQRREKKAQPPTTVSGGTVAKPSNALRGIADSRRIGLADLRAAARARRSAAP